MAWLESERIAALHRYDILDTQTDGAFDDFVRIAAHVCETPIAAVNLIETQRQWFAAEVGIGVQEMPIELSICAQALLQPGLTVVADLTKDSRFNCNPLVANANPALRFYGGAPLQTAEGLPIGTMCVLDTKARPNGLTEQQRHTMQALARQVMTQLELRRALRERTEALAVNERLVAETRELLGEKELLLLEVHHRVKNSLATVQALLLLQARAAKDEVASRQLRESAARVSTFGAMHEHLYRVGAAAKVSIASYLSSLIDDQRRAFAEPLGRIITFQADDAEWTSSEAPALGMIVVELVTNALKYGTGTVAVALRHATGEAVLTVEDEGHALPADFEPSARQGLGMRVVSGLLGGERQGRLEVDRSRGHTCFVARMRPALA